MAPMVAPESDWQGNPGDEDGLGRLRCRLWQLDTAAATVLVTAWLCTLGSVPAVIALLVAKHVLVSILVMRHDMDAGRRAEV